MKKSIMNLKQSLSVLGLIASFVVYGAAPVALASPTDVINNSCAQQGSSNSALCTNNGTVLVGSNTSIFNKIINVIISVIGAVAVLMIVIGGLRYVLSGGDSGAVTSAKNTILYAVVGLAVAILAFAIVNFVITKV